MDIHYKVPTSYEPISRNGPTGSPSGQSFWITDAMTNLGYTKFPPSWYFDNVLDYDNSLRTTFNTDWAYTIFVVDSSNDIDGKFLDGYSGYAYLGGPFVVMTYDNDGYGIINMDYVTAHETGHIFYATDEYNGVTEYSGYLNAYDIESSGFIMHCALCWGTSSGTALQLGWRDTDGDGILDIIDFPPVSTLNIYSPNPTNDNTPTYTGRSTSFSTYPNNNPNPWSSKNSITINKIKNIQYNVDGGPWIDASPVDGLFNSSSEDFTFTTSILSDGTHTIYVRTQNTAGNWETAYASDTLTIDATAPVLSFVSPTPSNNSNLTLNYVYINVTSNENLITPRLEWNGVNESISGSGMNWYKNKSGLSDGNYRFRVWGNDIPNNWNATELRVVTVDTRPPIVTANPTGYPAYQTASKNGGLITLNATITDLVTGVKNATVNASQINSSIGNVVLNYNSGFWTNSSVRVNASDGIYYLNITSFDHAGNRNNTEQITVIVDTSSPIINSAQTDYPIDFSAAKNGTSITLNTSISDFPAGVKNATINASQINRSIGNVVLSYGNGSWKNSSVIVNASDGTYKLNITAYDNAGNLNNTAQITVIVDNTIPNVTINPISYQRGIAANTGSIIGFSASADDPLINSTSAGLKNASVNASLINNTGRIELTNQSGIWRGNTTFDKFITDGNYSLNVTFFDNAGNINDSVQINVTIDNTPPSVTNVSLSSQFIDVSSFTNISANITSLDAVSLVNQSEVFVRVTYPNSSSINYPMNAGGGSLFYYNFIDTAQYGRFNVTILANDTTGNINSTQRIQFATVFITNNESVVIQANNITVFNAPLSNATLYLFTNNTSVGAINITQSRVNITSNEMTITNPGIYVNVNVSSTIRNNLSYVIIYVNYTDAEVSSYIESSLRLYKWNTSSSSWDRLSGAGSFPYVNNAGVDTANNFVWANLTELSEFAVSGELYVPPPSQTTTSGSSGGGGGGGGGASAENYSNIELKEKRDNYIFKDKIASYKFNTTDPIMYVNITGNISAGEVTTMVEVLRNTSSLVKNISAPGIIYKNMNIWVGTSGFATPKNIQKGVITFRVLNSWLEDKKLTAGDVRLVKWDGSRWIELDTYETTKSSEHIYYEAVTDSFSPFAITAFRSDVPVEAVKTPVTANETPAPEEIEVKREETSGLNGTLLVTAVVLVILVAILAAVYMKEKKKL